MYICLVYVSQNIYVVELQETRIELCTTHVLLYVHTYMHIYTHTHVHH